jgi:uncharacterized protein YacL
MPFLSLRALWIVLGAISGYLVAAAWSTALWHQILGTASGALVGGLVALLERWLERHPLRNLVGGALGLILGLWTARMVLGAFPAHRLSLDDGSALWAIFLLVFLGSLGWALGFRKGHQWTPGMFPWSRREDPIKRRLLLDTSVIIDGRIADICGTGFLQETLSIPQFILRELQQIADSSDPLKRARGRRGLDVLRKIQDQHGMEVEILDQDFPRIRDVDAKLVEMGKQLGCPILTNDFNLNQVAELQGIRVLNINQLAHALKPVLLPGEVFRVRVIKEGKEEGQGVGYLEDGTMVVVDSAKRFMGKAIDVAVTSVLQTTAGRMIFTVVKEETDSQVQHARG